MEKSRKVFNKNLAVAIGLGVGAAGVFAISNQAQAFPAFSRHYKVECATCHTHMPERNAFGEAFERNGFIWPSDKKPAAATSGNEALMLSGIPDEVPISLFARVTSTYN
ncbi:MAG: hypothetical protein PHI06_02485, partial [Desulfobulbaceae bacterium]|nr:hypothetical protein [Desulfobulbaceae bacterium]